MIRLAVFGSPVSQSRSPAIHNLFARQCGLEVDYRAIEASDEHFTGLVNELAAEGGRGCNITAPLKNQAWRLAQRYSQSAQRARVANTLRFDAPDDWYADNTDGRGLVQDIGASLECELGATRICILGAGGATAGILGDLLDQKPAAIVIANRTLEHARNLQDSFGAEVGVVSLDDLGESEPFDLVINATSLGHAGQAPHIPTSILLPDSFCYDLNYGGAADPLRDYCLKVGIRYSDGLGMLVEQAALSFELWTGQMPNTAPVLNALRKTL